MICVTNTMDSTAGLKFVEEQWPHSARRTQSCLSDLRVDMIREFVGAAMCPEYAPSMPRVRPEGSSLRLRSTRNSMSDPAVTLHPPSRSLDAC